MGEISRRKLLAALPVMTPAAVAAVAVSTNRSKATVPHPDAHLLQLAAEFSRLHPLWRVAKAHADEGHGAFHRAMMVRRWDRNPTWDDMVRVRNETGYTALLVAEEDAAEACNRIADAVRATPAATLTGLLVKVRLAAYDCHISDQMDGPEEDLDWVPRCFLALLREIERMLETEGTRDGEA